MTLDGVREWDNGKNRFHVIRVHYTADPEKRKPSWKKRTQPEYSEAAWDQEQEINFGSYAGRGIYRREFHNDLVENGGHVLDHYNLTDSRPIYRIWDFGYHHPAVVFIQEDGKGHHVIFDELMGDDIFLHNFVPLILEKTDAYAEQYSGIIKDFCDRAATQKKSTGKSDLEILHEFGIHPSYQQFDIVSTVNYVRRALKIRRGDNQPVLMVVGSQCPVIVAGMAGGYRYPKLKPHTAEKEQPLKDGYYEHLQDCIRYYAGHKLRFLKATMEVINGKIRSNESKGEGGSDARTGELQQILVRGSTIPSEGDSIPGRGRFNWDGGKPQIPTAEDGEDDGDEARYAQNGDRLPSAFKGRESGKATLEEVGGIKRRQIITSYNPIAGPKYSRIGG